MAALEPGCDAPAFRLEGLDGEVHSLDDLAPGDLLLLVFYHGACPTCQFAMPFIGNLTRGLASSRAKVWGISQDEKDETLRFAGDKGLKMPLMVDAPPYPVSQAYGMTNVPTLFLIDHQKRIVATCVGFSKADFLGIAQSLARNAGLDIPDIFSGAEVPALRPG